MPGVIMPQRQDRTGKVLQGASTIGPATGTPVGTAIGAGAGVINMLRPEQPQMQALGEDNEMGAIARRADLANQDVKKSLMEARESLAELPPQVRQRYDEILALALEQSKANRSI